MNTHGKHFPPAFGRLLPVVELEEQRPKVQNIDDNVEPSTNDVHVFQNVNCKFSTWNGCHITYDSIFLFLRIYFKGSEVGGLSPT